MEVGLAFSVVDALDQHVASLETPREPDGTWHPSQIFGCPRKAIYEQRGTEPSDPLDDRTKRVFRVGHMFHEFVQDAVNAHPDIVESYSEVGIEVPPLNLSGHLDGVVRLRTGNWEVLEFKTISSRGFSYSDLPKPEHINQVSVYLLALRNHGATVDGALIIPALGDLLSRARIIYISKDDLRVEEFPILWSPAKEREIVARVQELQAAQQSGTLPTRLVPTVDRKTGKSKRAWQCGYCPFRTLCWEGS